MKQRILITGAAGQLGRALVRVLAPGNELLPCDRVREPDDVTYIDITDESQVMETVVAFDPHVIVNAAAYTDVDGNECDPDLAREVNVTGVEHLLSAGADVGARLIQIGTDYVFDGRSGPYLESDPVNPLSMYGRTKLEAERLVLGADRHLVVRANVLFGPGNESPASFVRWVVFSLQDGKPIRVVDDQINNPTLTTHLAEAIAAAIEKGGRGLYHYGGLEFCNRYEFALKIAAHFGLSSEGITPIATTELRQPAPRPLNSGLVCSKMKVDLGVSNYTLDEALTLAFPQDQA